MSEGGLTTPPVPPGTPSPLTLRSNNPWEMFSETMNPDTRWWMGPASPQWGRRTKVWKPLFLQRVFECHHHPLTSPEPPEGHGFQARAVLTAGGG